MLNPSKFPKTYNNSDEKPKKKNLQENKQENKEIKKTIKSNCVCHLKKWCEDCYGEFDLFD